MGGDAMQMGQEAITTGVCLLHAVAALLPSLHVALSGNTHVELLPFLVGGVSGVHAWLPRGGGGWQREVGAGGGGVGRLFQVTLSVNCWPTLVGACGRLAARGQCIYVGGLGYPWEWCMYCCREHKESTMHGVKGYT